MPEFKIDQPYPQQIAFFEARARHVAYGGSRGGGKSWAARNKACLLCLTNDGIQVLLLRRTMPELKLNHLFPLQEMLKGIALYKQEDKLFIFPNGSRLMLGFCDKEADVLRYQGQSFDVIFLEEATHFTLYQYNKITECCRLSGLCKKQFTPRMYYTCNPGGVGHNWMKRLFIDRAYKASEKPEDYVFIPSSVYDNKWLLEHDPEYVRKLENLPEDQKKADLYGDWNIFSGQYFDEFDTEIHTCKPFDIPPTWNRYFTMDYGLDMLAGYWIALDEHGRAYVYRELYKPKLIIREAARAILAMMPKVKTSEGDETDIPTEHIEKWFAPPDLWNRRQDSGKNVADMFRENGIILTKTSNDRATGWLALKEWMAPFRDTDGELKAKIVIFKTCENLIRCLPLLQYNNKDRNDAGDVRDVTSDNHEITHAPDALRYFVNGRVNPTSVPPPSRELPGFRFETKRSGVEVFGVGAEISTGYMHY